MSGIFDIHSHPNKASLLSSLLYELPGSVPQNNIDTFVTFPAI
jgi:hypothetical protein